MKKRKLFYGWIVVFAGMAVIGTTIGIVHNCFGLFIVPISTELGFSREAMGYAQMIFSAAMILVALMAGPIFQKLNMRRLMILSGVTLAASYALFSTAQSLFSFYLISVAVAFSVALVSNMPFSIIVRNWFSARLGLALGATYMGSGLGGMLFNLLGGFLIERAGWRATFLWFSAIMALVLLPILLFVIKIKPEDMGLRPLGESETAGDSPSPRQGLTLGEARQTPRFYILVLTLVMTGLAVNSVAVTITPHYTGVLNSAGTAASISSLFMACLAFGKFFMGWMFDRLGARGASLIAALLLAATLLSMAAGASIQFIALFLATGGIACAYGTVPMGLLAERAFGARDYGAITGIFSAASSLGAMLAPPLCGKVFDVTASYAPAYRAMALLMAAVTVPMMLGIPALQRKFSR